MRQEDSGTPGPRLVLQVRWGHMAYQKMVLEPGQVIRVGRAKAMEMPVPHDAEMADAHFELAWDGSQGRVRDLKSATGTLLGGERVDEGSVHHGDWIRAGTTDFSVYCEGGAPPAPNDEAAPAQQPMPKAHFLAVLGGQKQLFAVLDAARSPRVLELLQESTEEYRTLYEGPQGESLAEVAPYLVKLPARSRLLERLLTEGWGQAWGIYFTCPLPFLDTRRHLRKFLMVEAESEAERLYFRFYDPRVLATFLPTCTQEQKKAFLGPITEIFHEADDKLVSSSG